MHEHWKVLDVIITHMKFWMLSSPTWYYKNQAIVWQGPCGELDLALNNLSRRGVGILTQSIELASY